MQKRELEPEALRFICRNLRPESKREVFACRENDDPDALCSDTLRFSTDLSWVLYHDDWPVYAGGASPGVDAPWFTWGMGTPDMTKIAKPLTKFVKRDMLPEVFARGADKVETWVLAGNPVVQNWMAFLGAKPLETLQLGRFGDSFTHYRWGRDDVLRR